MSGSTLLRLRRRIADAFEDEVRAVQNAPASPQSMAEIETLVRECLNHAREFRPMWQAVLAMLDSDEVVPLEPVGRELQTIFERGLQVLRSMQAVCRQYQHGGLTIPSARELNRELADLQAFSAGLFKNWPWENVPYKACDPIAVAQARAELDRGEYVDLEDLIRDLQSQDPASE